jgi:hypothetical protein
VCLAVHGVHVTLYIWHIFGNELPDERNSAPYTNKCLCGFDWDAAQVGSRNYATSMDILPDVIGAYPDDLVCDTCALLAMKQGDSDGT